MGYISLHNHTYASNIRMIDSINRPNQMIKKALSLGFKGMAITDHEALSCHVELLKIRDEIKEKNPDFKIILGNEIYLIDESEYKNTKNYYHFILLAKDLEGYQQIKQLSSLAWDRSYIERGLRRCPTFYQDIEKIIQSNPGHVIASSACLGSRISKAILAKDKKEINSFIPWCIKIFGRENFFLELQVSDSKEQIICNQYLIKLAQFFKLDYIVTTDSHYLDKEDFSLFTAFLNSKSSSDRETESFYKYTYIMSEQEMKEILIKGITEEQSEIAINNTEKIYNMITDFDMRHPTIVPTISIPNFQLEHILKPWYESCPAIKEIAYSTSEQNRYMLYLIEQGIKEKHFVITKKEADRLQEEFDVILYISQELKQDISAYLNLVKEVIDISWEVSFVGVSRGSAGAFLTNYLMGITQINPLQFNVPSFRFLNKARADALPDIDYDTSPDQTANILQLLRDHFGENNVLNCATFKTESLKSAILTSCRGMNINNDEAQALAALVPSQRGITYNLRQCLYGDEEKDLKPVPDFESKLRKYPGLFEMVSKIEGLPTNVSIHASAVYIFKNGYIEHNSLMRAPNGTKITCWNMHDSDDCSALKLDLLRTDAESKLMKTMELLINDNKIQWQGSLRNTYNKYIHPDVLEYKDLKMWEKAYTGQIHSIFQMDTAVGMIGISKMKPTSVEELATVNGLIRLTADSGEESSVERYERFKNDINQWYQEMNEAGLSQHEQDILRRHLGSSYGLCYNQEAFMMLLMDPEISNFTLKDADKGRKILSKKKVDQIEGFKNRFLTSESPATPIFKQYVWDKMIAPQMKYSFNLAHGIGYSLIGLQEMNLAHKFNPLYWDCACLCCNSGSSLTEFEDETEEEEEEFIENFSKNKDFDENIKTRHVAPNYGKIAKAIADAQSQGVTIELPDINTAQADFIPDVKQNAILYSLRAITVVSDDLMDRIINNRPYSSWKDFCEKVQPTTIQMIGLIKAGCFDKLMGQSRKQIMIGYLQYNADNTIELKSKLTSVHLNKAIDLHMVLKEYVEQVRLFKFKKFIDYNQLDKTNKRYVLTDTSSIKFATTFIIPLLSATKSEYGVTDSSTVWIKESSFKREYDKKMLPLMQYLKSEEGLKKYREIEQAQYISELKEKYCKGTMAAWEMQTMCFYHEPHELSKVNKDLYNLANFNELPEYPDKNIDKSKNNLYALVGTITDTNNLKHIVSILTTTGIVNVKFFGGTYTNFNQSISEIDPQTKKKTVKDATWFKRGNKIIVYGERRENMFTAKKDYKNFGRIVGLIEKVYDNGTMDVRYTRNKK